jgi:hypothetical protein
MYKSKFKYIGQVTLIPILGILSPFLLYVLVVDIISSNENQYAMIFVCALLLFTTLVLWLKTFKEINKIEITDSIITIRNILSRKTIELKKQELKGYKDTFSDGYMILLIDKNNKTVGKIKNYYYQDFKALIKNLDIKYIERVPTRLDKIFKIKY